MDESERICISVSGGTWLEREKVATIIYDVFSDKSKDIKVSNGSHKRAAIPMSEITAYLNQNPRPAPDPLLLRLRILPKTSYKDAEELNEERKEQESFMRWQGADNTLAEKTNLATVIKKSVRNLNRREAKDRTNRKFLKKYY